jgi:hypothetical protein
MQRKHVVTIAIMVVSLASLQASAQIQNPIKAARDAIKKAREANPPKTPEKAPASGATKAPETAAPWTPPADTANAQPVVLDPLKLPDVIGVHIGMTPAQALEAVRKQYPKDIYQRLTDNAWPDAVKPDFGYTVLSSAPGNRADIHLSFTALPNPQVVWKAFRYTYGMHINHATLLMALREKYGKETVAFQESSSAAVTDDRRMADLFWLFDERGGRVPLPSAATLSGNTIMACLGSNPNPQPVMPTDDVEFTAQRAQGWCNTSFVGVHVYISSQEIVENTSTEVVDIPLAVRTARASAAWLRDVAEKRRKEELEKSKNVKPVL